MSELRETPGKPRLVYILSPSFSGSTLLTLLLAQHRQIVTMGELKATSMGELADYQCSCGAAIQGCDFWREVIHEVAARGGAFSLAQFGTHFRSRHAGYDRVLRARVRGPLFESVRRQLLKSVPGLAREYRQVMAQNRMLIEVIQRQQGADIFLDGSKDPQRLLYFLRSGHWSIDVIRLHRDGRAQSHSQRLKARGQLGFGEAAREWATTIGEMARVCEAVPDGRLHTLDYESLCRDPAAEMARIWRFLQVPALDRDWQQIDLKSPEQHILGNNMRTKSQITIKLDEKWRDQVNDGELQLFEQRAGRVNRALGYR